MAPEDNPADEIDREEYERGLAAMDPIPPYQQSPRLPTVQPKTIMDVIAQVATEPDGDVEKLERLLAMKERIEAKEEERQFNAAKAAWKLVAPEVFKKKAVGYEANGQWVGYKHADLGYEIAVLERSLAEHGLTVDWDAEQKGHRIFVTCILRHVGGHKQCVTLDEEPDNTGSKNKHQGLGSGLSYLQRYTFEMVTGTRPIDDRDDDARGTGKADPLAPPKKVVDWKIEYARRVDEESEGLTADNISDYCEHRGRIRMKQTWRDLTANAAQVHLDDWPGFTAAVRAWKDAKDE